MRYDNKNRLLNVKFYYLSNLGLPTLFTSPSGGGSIKPIKERLMLLLLMMLMLLMMMMRIILVVDKIRFCISFWAYL